ncbi:MAG: ABC transporter substrate-binding protein, partial [Actinobacteria bacterium]|nr:ABC transporter substrate-binding protein [Actinomycetota bacterium]
MRRLLRRTGDPRSIRGPALLAAAALALLAAACGGSQPHGLAVGTVADTGAGAGAASGGATGGVAGTADAGSAGVPGTPAAVAGGAAVTPGASSGAPAGTRPAAGTAGGTAAGAGTASGSANPRAAQAAGQNPGAPSLGGGGGPAVGGGGAAAPDNGGATDVGISADSIRYGSISGNNTPLGNLISQPVTTAVFATMRAINDSGGIFGRKMVIADCDDSGAVTRFRSCYRKLIDESKIFAFITSVTWGTGEVHGDLARDKIPWIGSWGFYTSEWK